MVSQILSSDNGTATLTVERGISDCNIDVHVQNDGLRHELERPPQRLEEYLRCLHVGLTNLALAEDVLDASSLADAPSASQENGLRICLREPKDKNNNGESTEP